MTEAEGILDTLEEQIAPNHTALVIVDVLNDFTHPEGFFAQAGLYVPGKSLVPDMLPRLETLLAAARKANVFTVFVQAVYDLKYMAPAIIQRYHITGEYNNNCLEGTWGDDFYGNIRPDGRDNEAVVKKHRYSGFWGTNLDMILRSNGIKSLVMTGVATAGCVESTTRDGFFNGYYVVSVEDCCADKEKKLHDFSLEYMNQFYGYVVSSEAVMSVWSQQKP